MCTINIQNRTRQRTGEVIDAPLVTKHISKVGNESLIFNPTVALTIQSRGTAGSSDVYIPLSLFYRFTSNLSAVYEALSDAKLYHTEGPVLYVDKKRAITFARKLPLFRNTLTLVPDVFIDRANVYAKGIVFLVDAKPIGVIHHQEALGMIEQLDRLDITCYSLMAAVVEELDTTINRLDGLTELMTKTYRMVECINETLTKQQMPTVAILDKPQSPESPLKWSSVIDWRPMG